MVLRKRCQQPAKIAVAKKLCEPIAGGHEVFMLAWISHRAIVGAFAKLKSDCCYLVNSKAGDVFRKFKVKFTLISGFNISIFSNVD